jgi:8-oxo-dGTP diphosphatase
MNKRDFHHSLPKKRMAAGAIFRDEQARVLLVKPTYKEGWDIPGGVVEANESPRAACEREVLEELGLQVSACQLVIVDYIEASNTRLEGVQFIFDCGILVDAVAAQIVLPANELSEYRFVARARLYAYLSPPKTQRIATAVHMIDKQRTAYLESTMDESVALWQLDLETGDDTARQS